MKKVLIISFHFPPRPNIGSQRPYKLSKYLKEHGWEPVVLTAKLPALPPQQIRVIQTDYMDVLTSFKKRFKLLGNGSVNTQHVITENNSSNKRGLQSKAKRILRELLAYPDEQRGWFRFALKEAFKLLDKESFDAMISTSYPVTSHLIAHRIKERYNIPWIADLRDLWTQNQYVHKHEIIKYFEERLERKILSEADLLVTVTPNWVEDLKKLHRNKEIVYIPNGYDEDDYQDGEPVELTKKFTLTYTGRLYEGKRDPSMLFEVVSELIKKNVLDESLIEIRFFGPEERWLEERIKKYNLERVVKIYGFVSRQEAIRRQMESQVLLLLLWNNEYEKGVCPGKVYEYFAARRPIIATGGPGGVVKDLITETNTGRYIMEKKELESAISDYYEEYIKTGQVHYRGNGKITHYNYKKITERYAEVLERIVDGSWVNE